MGKQAKANKQTQTNQLNGWKERKREKKKKTVKNRSVGTHGQCQWSAECHWAAFLLCFSTAGGDASFVPPWWPLEDTTLLGQVSGMLPANKRYI